MFFEIHPKLAFVIASSHSDGIGLIFYLLIGFIVGIYCTSEEPNLLKLTVVGSSTWPGIRGTQVKSSVRMEKTQESSKSTNPQPVYLTME